MDDLPSFSRSPLSYITEVRFQLKCCFIIIIIIIIIILYYYYYLLLLLDWRLLVNITTTVGTLYITG